MLKHATQSIIKMYLRERVDTNLLTKIRRRNYRKPKSRLVMREMCQLPLLTSPSEGTTSMAVTLVLWRLYFMDIGMEKVCDQESRLFFFCNFLLKCFLLKKQNLHILPVGSMISALELYNQNASIAGQEKGVIYIHYHRTY